MLLHKKILVEDWAVEQIAEAMEKIYNTPERKKILQNFELEISKFIKIDSDKEME